MKSDLRRARRERKLREDEDPKRRKPGMTKLKTKERNGTLYIKDISGCDSIRKQHKMHHMNHDRRKICSHQKRYRCDISIRENVPISNKNSTTGKDEMPERKINQFC